MADFFQNGLITTLHDLRSADPAWLEEMVVEAARTRPTALILPVTASDMRADPFRLIVDALSDVEFLQEIVVVLDCADRSDDYSECLRRIAPLGRRANVLWTGSPHVAAVYAELEAGGIDLGSPGKGRSVWTAYGYLAADPTIEAYALHDCDIATYTRELAVRLCLPIVHPTFGFRFAKAYYARFGDRLHGRVARLLVTPLVRALKRVLGPNQFLDYLDSFRYPLSGEFAISADLARSNRVPGDWGLEIGTLAEVYRNVSLKRVCQIDIAPRYDHKHQPESFDDPGRGLAKMGHDIISSVFRTLTAMGTTILDEHVATISACYLRNAQDAVHQYSADALVNQLDHDRHAEEVLCEAFARAIVDVGQRIHTDPIGIGALPTWTRVEAAYPEVPSRLRAAALADLHDHGGAATGRPVR
jgi:glucosyl-3-phosphoglycerate synthase